MQDELETGGAEPADARRRRRPVLELDPLGKSPQRFVGRLLPGLDLVDLLHAVTGMREPVRERSRRSSAAALRSSPRRAARPGRRAIVADERDDGGPALRVACGRDDAGRLVQEHVAELLLRDPLTVHLDDVARLHERVQLARARRSHARGRP